VTTPPPLHLFEAIGIELEYMIVDRRTLAVRPIADQLLRWLHESVAPARRPLASADATDPARAAADTGGFDGEVELGPVAWSNELALHVVELKTNGPVPTLRGLAARLQGHVERLRALLEPVDALLMPTAMHPLMSPDRELRLWPHQNDAIYRAFDRIFDCRGHGWANLQSVHVNLPFHGDGEFGRLHAAIRAVLPILPALAASSPLAEGRLTGLHDTRMDSYARHTERVRSVAGAIVPEAVFTRDDYERQILGPIYDDLRPLDPEGVLCHEWVNARGAIARFDRGSIEIRVLDVQECPAADLAVAGAAIAALRALVDEWHAGVAELRALTVPALAAILRDAVAAGDRALLRDGAYLRLFGFPDRPPCRARDLWQHLFETAARREEAWPEWEPALALYAAEGCLAARITNALGERPGGEDIDRVYRELCRCLDRGELFRS